MQFSLVLTAFVMGLVGGPHCVAMCGAACAGLGQAAGPRKNSAIFLFQAGRVIGYSALGALSAASLQGLGWLTVQSAALRPVWSMFHVAALVLGLVLLWRAEQPIWLERAGRFLSLAACARVWPATRRSPLVAWQPVGDASLWFVVLGFIGRGFGWECVGWRSSHGCFCHRYQCDHDSSPLVVDAPTR